jgi:hypothetical protein
MSGRQLATTLTALDRHARTLLHGADPVTSVPRRTDPIAAALAFAIREAVRLEALPVAPDSAKVVAMNAKREARVA